MKTCSKCKIQKSDKEFYSDSRTPDGLYSICKKCHQISAKKWKTKNEKEYSEQQKEYRKSHSEERREYNIEYRASHFDKVKEWAQKYLPKKLEQSRKYRAEHPEIAHSYYVETKERDAEKRRAGVRNRRARRNYIEGKITAKEWCDLKEKYGNRCLCCGRMDVKLELDHVVPLAAGGEHSIKNAQPLCRKCNASKHIKIKDYRNEHNS